MTHKPRRLIDLEHARHLERIDGRARRRGFRVPVRLEADYQSLRFRHRYTAAEAATLLGIHIDRTV